MEAICGKAPLRISLAGGGTDLNYVFEKYGGAIINSTIDKYCHMMIRKRKDNQFFINDEPLNREKHVLASIIINKYKPNFGFDLYYYNDIAPGSGLGNSSSFNIIMLRLLHELDNKRLNDFDLVKEAYNIDTSLKEGGWQDQYACAFGGFNFMEFDKHKHLIYPLRLKYSFLCNLNEHLMLVKIPGVKENVHKEVRLLQQKDEDEFKKVIKIKDYVYDMRDALLNQDIDKIPIIIDSIWKLKRNNYVTSDEADKLYELGMANGAEGGRLCGSGKAGHFLFFVRPENKHKFVQALKDYSIINSNLNNEGAETWPSK